MLDSSCAGAQLDLSDEVRGRAGHTDEEQGTTARSRDTRAPATRGIASNARLAVCCLYRLDLRR